MHELQVTNRMLEIVLDHAKKNNVNKVLAIHLEIGELRDFEPTWIQHYFDYLSRDTVAADAKLVVEKIPITMGCQTCGTSFVAKLDGPEEIRCTACDSPACSLMGGNEYRVKHVEVL